MVTFPIFAGVMVIVSFYPSYWVFAALTYMTFVFNLGFLR